MICKTNTVATLFAAALIMTASVAVAADVVTVHYYNQAGIGSKALHEAIVMANRAFVAAHITVRWVNCHTEESAPSCSGETGPGVYEVSVIGAAPDGSGAKLPHFAMGHALVVPKSNSVYARIFLPRVAQYAEKVGVPVASVLGYAIAHEVGHLVLGTPEHANFGLMKAVWSRSEAHLLVSGRMDFDPHSVKILRNRLVGR